MIHSFIFFLGEKDYYEKQFATLRSFEEVDSLDSPNVIDEVEDHEQLAQHEIAIKISNWANIFLLAFKVISSTFFSNSEILVDGLAGFITSFFLRHAA
jgi:hypothetical protein